MQSYKVKKYKAENKSVWDSFISKSKNATFLFHRDFMEYHKDRFDDYSLMVFKDEKLVAMLPANKVGHELHSHQGLSYGGLTIVKEVRIEDYVEIVKHILQFLSQNGIETVIVKQLPFIYHSGLSEELNYLRHHLKARTVSFDSYFVLDDLNNYKPNRNRKRALLLAKKNQLKLSNEGLEFFWQSILTENLNSRFKSKPVHTIGEIKYLISKFPNQIRFFSVVMDDEIKAGAVVFITDTVAHIQYSAGDSDRNTTSALDFLFHEIIEIFKSKSYVSFGSSSTDSSLKINKGLAYWKESFGASTIVQEHFQVETENWKLLNSVFI